MLVPEAHMTGWKGVERGVGVEGRMRKAGEGAGGERWEEGERNYCSNLGLSGTSHYIQLPPDNHINSQEPTEIRMKASGGKHKWPSQDPK